MPHAAEDPDAIIFSCHGCGKKLRAAAEFGGKQVKCPKCGRHVEVPETRGAPPKSGTSVFQAAKRVEEVEQSPALQALFHRVEGDQQKVKVTDGAGAVQAPSKSCPFCGDQIPAFAIKCKSCGSDLVPIGQQSVPQTSGLAVASLVLGIVWLCGVGSLLATIFGAVALRQISVSGGRLGGKGLATAGLMLGLIGIALIVMLVVLAMLVASDPIFYQPL